MNYLAHLVLGGADSDVRLGNFIGDSIKGNQVEQYPDAVAAGIVLHRWIDSYADAHPIASNARAALRPRLGRLSAVGVDLLYDHFLAKNFEQCCPHLVDLESYADSVLEDLDQRKSEMPLRSRRFFEAMKTHNWLVGYGVRSEMKVVCRSMDHRIADRLGVPSNLIEIFDAAEEHGMDELEESFFVFWTEFLARAKTVCFESIHAEK